MGWIETSMTLLGLFTAVLPCSCVLRVLPRHSLRLCAFGPYLLFACLFRMPTWVADENPLFFLPVFLLVFLLCYGGSALSRLVTAIIFYPLFVSASMLVDSARNLWIGSSGIFTVAESLSKTLCWTLVWLLLQRILPDRKPLSLSSRMWAFAGALALAPLFSQLIFVLYSLHNIDSAIYDAVQEYVLRMAYTALPFVFLSCLALLYALKMLSRYERLAEERQMQQMNRAYYEQLERQQTQIRRLRHDMANHLLTLSTLPPEEHGAYLSQLLDSPALHPAAVWSENHVVNAVLSAKAEQMAADHIRADLSAPLPLLLPFTDVDLCALLANSLDNAMEACRKLPQDERRVTLKARMDKGLFALQVKNPCLTQPPCQGGRFHTTKPDAENHGFGLAGMESIAEKYGGTLETGIKDGVFTLLLCLPLH